MTSANSSGPSRDWLKLVATSKAKNKIKRFFKTQDREGNIEKGHEAVVKALQDLGFVPKEMLSKVKMQEALQRYNYHTEDDLFAAVGYGEVSPTTLANRLTEEERREQQIEKDKQRMQEIMNKPAKKEPEKMKIRHEGGVVIQGVENLLIRMSRCCNPVPGDDIVGYITKGRGISIHRADCPNVTNAPENENRLIEVEWEDTSSNQKEYAADLEIHGYDRSGLLNDVLQVISSQSKKLLGVTARSDKDKQATIRLSVSIQNLSHLQTITDKLKQVPDVYSVHRVKG
jgi:GTP pyrophosphokinase